MARPSFLISGNRCQPTPKRCSRTTINRCSGIFVAPSVKLTMPGTLPRMSSCGSAVRWFPRPRRRSCRAGCFASHEIWSSITTDSRQRTPPVGSGYGRSRALVVPGCGRGSQRGAGGARRRRPGRLPDAGGRGPRLRRDRQSLRLSRADAVRSRIHRTRLRLRADLAAPIATHRTSTMRQSGRRQ